jgi:hypothetical protein
MEAGEAKPLEAINSNANKEIEDCCGQEFWKLPARALTEQQAQPQWFNHFSVATVIESHIMILCRKISSPEPSIPHTSHL